MMRTMYPWVVMLAMAGGCAEAPEPAEESAALAVGSEEPASDGWERWLSEGVARVEGEQPALAARLRAAAPVTTRAGHPRFTDAGLDEPGAAVVLLDRLSHGTDPAAVRAAIAEALARTQGAYGAALVGLMARERDAQVRVAMVSALRRADAGPALAGLRAGLEDSDARVRVAAAEVASRRPDGASLAGPLIAGLADAAAEVQIAATRSLGALRVTQAFPALRAQLTGGSAELRLHSLRALLRIDAAQAAAIPELAALRQDSDARVAGAVAEIDLPR